MEQSVRKDKDRKKEDVQLKKLWNWAWGIYRKHEEVWNYLIFGFLAFVVNMVAYWVSAKALGADSGTPLKVQIATAIAWVVAVIFAYWTNHSFVFKTKLHSMQEFYREFGVFIGARIVTYIMEIIIMFVLPTMLGVNDLVSKLVSNVIVIISNYIFSKLFIFKKEESKNEEETV